MKKILVISHLKVDSQASLVESLLERRGARIFRLCTNAGSWETGLAESRDGITMLGPGGRKYRPDAVWYATHPRCDSLDALSFEFPGEHRSSVSQMIKDIHYAFDGSLRWVPGSIEAIERADSKLAMLGAARKLGFSVPRHTVDAPRPVAAKVFCPQIAYRKKLGFPCVTTFVRSQGVEMNSTVPNVLGQANSGRTLWQWQSPIPSIAHVRCCVVGRRVWSVRWDRPSPMSSLCDYRTCGAENEFWNPVLLEASLGRRLPELLENLGLVVACPEFLVTKGGEHVLIDLNPTGDWGGFFGKKERTQIASSIADEILKVRH